jgi:hypothetical protein
VNVQIHIFLTLALNFRQTDKAICVMRHEEPQGWDLKAPTFSRQSAHRWRWGCQPYAPATFYFQEGSWYPCQRLSWLQSHSAAGRIRSIEKSSDLIRKWTRDLAWSTVLHPKFGLKARFKLKSIQNQKYYGTQESSFIPTCQHCWQHCGREQWSHKHW